LDAKFGSERDGGGGGGDGGDGGGGDDGEVDKVQEEGHQNWTELGVHGYADGVEGEHCVCVLYVLVVYNAHHSLPCGCHIRVQRTTFLAVNNLWQIKPKQAKVSVLLVYF
jgi:hypothetical protein